MHSLHRECFFLPKNKKISEFYPDFSKVHVLISEKRSYCGGIYDERIRKRGGIVA